MKKYFTLLFCLSCISIATFGQKLTTDKVPAVVQSALKNKFPTATKIKWEMEDKKDYEAEFILKDKEMSATFDQKGNWIETETEMKIADLTPGIKDAIAKQFSGYKAEEACKVENANGINYEADLKKGEEKLEVLFNNLGEVISKKVESDDEDDND